MKKIDETKIAEIARLRALGYSQGEIAKKLGISQTSVAYHLKKLKELAEDKGEDEVFKIIIAALLGISAGMALEYILSLLQQKKK